AIFRGRGRPRNFLRTGKGGDGNGGRMRIAVIIALASAWRTRPHVAKVDELMALCDCLEASLTTADETRRRLLDALLAEALTPAAAGEGRAAEGAQLRPAPKR